MVFTENKLLTIMRTNQKILQLLALLFLNISIAQISSYKISLKQQILESSLVVEGKVVSKKTSWDINHQMIYTINVVEVYKVFKGTCDNQIIVLTKGGFIDDEGITASHSLNLSIGEVGLFTLFEDVISLRSKTDNLKQYKVYSSDQGFYNYDLYTDQVSNPFSLIKGIKSFFYKEVENITKKTLNEIKKFDVNFKANKSSLNALQITSFSPSTVSAGTKSVLTINGSGFGTSIGSVGFRNADNGGSNFINALPSEILTWTDTSITVYVNQDAGTGTIRVINANNETFTSTAVLTVTFSQVNAVPNSGPNAFQLQQYNQNGSGGMTFQFRQEIFDNVAFPGAKAAFERALNTWRCETKINWNFSNTGTNATRTTPDVNLITFDGNGIDQEAVGRLGTTYTNFSGRTCSGTQIWVITNIDIVFDRERNWNFQENATLQNGQFDFQTIALHELGHAHQLGHVINTNDLMHFSNSGLVFTLPDQNSITGAKDVQLRSVNNPICSGNPQRPVMTNYDGNCFLSLTENDLTNEKTLIYPNPVSNNLHINNDSNKSIDKIIIYDLNGRKIMEQFWNQDIKTNTINIEHLSKGPYVITIEAKALSISKKIIIE